MGAFFLSLTALDPRGEPLGSNVLFICAYVSRCEVQYDYGLRQRRSKPLKSRPTSFKTEKGKEIVVEQKTAAKREKIVTAGTVSNFLFLLRKATFKASLSRLFTKYWKMNKNSKKCEFALPRVRSFGRYGEYHPHLASP